MRLFQGFFLEFPGRRSKTEIGRYVVSPYGQQGELCKPVLRLRMDAQASSLEEVKDLFGSYLPYHNESRVFEVELQHPRRIRLRVLTLTAAKKSKRPDRLLQVIRSRADFFWNLVFFFELLRLNTDFLLGGIEEFRPRGAGSMERWKVHAKPCSPWFLSLREYNQPHHTLASSNLGLYKELLGLLAKNQVKQAIHRYLEIRSRTPEVDLESESSDSDKRGGVSTVHNPWFRGSMFYNLGSLLPCNDRKVYTRFVQHYTAVLREFPKYPEFHELAKFIIASDNPVIDIYVPQIQDFLLLINDTAGDDLQDFLDEEQSSSDNGKGEAHPLLRNHHHNTLSPTGSFHSPGRSIKARVVRKELPRNLPTKSHTIGVNPHSYNGLPSSSVLFKDFHSALCSHTFSLLETQISAMDIRSYVPRLRDFLCKPHLIDVFREFLEKSPRFLKFISFAEHCCILYQFRQNPEVKTIPISSQQTRREEACDDQVGEEKRTSKLIGTLCELNEEDEMGFWEYASYINNTFINPDSEQHVKLSDPRMLDEIQNVLNRKYSDAESYSIFDEAFEAVVRYLQQHIYLNLVVYISESKT